MEEFDDGRAYSKGQSCFTGSGAQFTVWTANQDIAASSTEPTRESPQDWIGESGPGSIRGLLSDINVNVLRAGDIFWLEETESDQRVFFTETAGTYTSASAMIDASIELTPGAAIEAHNTSSTAHNSIRSLISANEDRLDALDPLEIEAYDSSATYSRGSVELDRHACKRPVHLHQQHRAQLRPRPRHAAGLLARAFRGRRVRGDHPAARTGSPPAPSW